MVCSPAGSSVHGISQARILEWAAISFSRGSSQVRDWTCISCTDRRILYHWAPGLLMSLPVQAIMFLYRWLRCIGLLSRPTANSNGIYMWVIPRSLSLAEPLSEKHIPKYYFAVSIWMVSGHLWFNEAKAEFPVHPTDLQMSFPTSVRWLYCPPNCSCQKSRIYL